MFLYSLSEETFHKGLKIYLSKSTSNPEGVAKPEHLYEALQQAADADKALPANHLIADLFGSWEKQAGYPIVYVERSYNDYRVRLTQVRTIGFTRSVDCLLNLSLSIHSLRIDLRTTLPMESFRIHSGLFQSLTRLKQIPPPTQPQSFG